MTIADDTAFFAKRSNAKAFSGKKSVDANLAGHTILVVGETRFYSIPDDQIVEEETIGDLVTLWVKNDAAIWTCDRSGTQEHSAFSAADFLKTFDRTTVLSGFRNGAILPGLANRPRGKASCMKTALGDPDLAKAINDLPPISANPVWTQLDRCVKALCFGPNPPDITNIIADTTPNPAMSVADFLALYGQT